MKKPIILLTLLMALCACSVNEKPEFISVKHIDLVEVNRNHVILKAEAIFRNPNSIGGQLKTDHIQVLVNDVEVTTVFTEAFNVPAKDEFTIPMVAKIAKTNIINTKTLSGLLESVLSQRIKVQYKGDIIYSLLDFSYTYTVDKTDNIELKL